MSTQEATTFDEGAPNWGFVPEIAPTAQTPATVAAAARELGVISAMVQSAQAHPRHEFAVVQRIRVACERLELAQKATYRMKRGGEDISGPSAQFARFLASVWGNLRFGIEIVDDTPTSRHIRGSAHELQSNTYASFDHCFQKRVQRKDRRTGVTSWVDTEDEAAIREMTARWGALLVRNAILALIPPDVVDKAQATCASTLQLWAEKRLSKNREDATHSLLVRFDRVGVSAENIEQFLEHSLSAITGEELAKLEQILLAIREGQASRSDFFDLRPAVSAEGAAIVETLQAQIATAEKDGPAKPLPWVSAEQMQAINQAISTGACNDRHVAAYRRSIGLGKGAKMTGAQADDLIAMIRDGRVSTLIDDGVS